MPKKGYWVECMPLWDETNQNDSPDLYRASLPAMPDMVENAPSASQAIEKLRRRLKDLRKNSNKSGMLLPRLENPVRPPKRPEYVRGWMSVYIDMQD